MRLPATYSRRMAPDMAHSDAYGLNCYPEILKSPAATIFIISTSSARVGRMQDVALYDSVSAPPNFAVIQGS